MFASCHNKSADCQTPLVKSKSTFLSLAAKEKKCCRDKEISEIFLNVKTKKIAQNLLNLRSFVISTAIKRLELRNQAFVCCDEVSRVPSYFGSVFTSLSRPQSDNDVQLDDDNCLPRIEGRVCCLCSLTSDKNKQGARSFAKNLFLFSAEIKKNVRTIRLSLERSTSDCAAQKKSNKIPFLSKFNDKITFFFSFQSRTIINVWVAKKKIITKRKKNRESGAENQRCQLFYVAGTVKSEKCF